MESFFVRFKNPLILVAVLLLQTIGLAVQVRRPVAPGIVDTGASDPRSISLVRYWVVSIVTPFESFFHGIGHNIYAGWSNYVDLRNVRQQNAALQQQLADMRIQQAAIAQDALQGHRLQALLDFQQHYVTSTVAAQVIGTSGTELSRVLYIDKGREEGLKPDQAVITPDGIVGKIRDVFPHTAQILLIDDQSSGAGVIFSSSRIRAILHGDAAGRVVITNLTPDSRIKPGETVLTSGGDQVYPRGLPVGTIESIALDLDHQPYTIIRVRPAARLSQLEEVLVITGTQAQLPPQAQQDLAAGAETAAAKARDQAAAQATADATARTAAEVVADRLPSLNDGNQDPNHPADPNNPNAAQPAADATAVHVRPLPTIHPDRYTPGTTPPAADLTPGSPHSTTAPPPQPSTPRTPPTTESQPNN
jgi:rod shape-determining protein MreC